MDFKYEMVVPNEDLPCKFFIFEGKNGNYRRANHWHQSVEIFLVLEGELKFYINNQSQPLSAGELIIVNSNEIHSIEARSTLFPYTTLFRSSRSRFLILPLIWEKRTMPYL